MALNIKVFKTRTLTAIVFAAIMLCGLLLNSWTFLLLFLIISFGCWFEYRKLINLIIPSYKNVPAVFTYAIIFFGFGFILWMTDNAFFISTLNLKQVGFFIMMISLCLLLFSFIFYKKSVDATVFFGLMIGLIYISADCAFMLNLRTASILKGDHFNLDSGLLLPLLIIASMWINDTMAYIVGSVIGKTPLSSISPKKTVEGTVGGALLAIITITVSGVVFFKIDVLQLAVLTTIACIAGVFGDLFESKLKRMADVKDSGSIMPGHGGFLDRFDSMLLATGFVWLYVKLFV